MVPNNNEPFHIGKVHLSMEQKKRWPCLKLRLLLPASYSFRWQSKNWTHYFHLRIITITATIEWPHFWLHARWKFEGDIHKKSNFVVGVNWWSKKIFKKIACIQSHHHHLQWKFKILAGKFAWGAKAKHCCALSTNFFFRGLLTKPSNVLPLHLKQTFQTIIWIFTEGEGDGIKFRLPFKIFSTLKGS